MAALLQSFSYNLRELGQTWLICQPYKFTVKRLRWRAVFICYILSFLFNYSHSTSSWVHTLGRANRHMAYLHAFFFFFCCNFEKGKILITHHIRWFAALLNDSHYTLEALVSTVLLVAETGTGKSLLSLKATENRSLWAGRSFSLQLHNYRYSGLSSSTRASRGPLSIASLCQWCVESHLAVCRSRH